MKIQYTLMALAFPALSFAINKVPVQHQWVGTYTGANIGAIFNDADMNANHISLSNIEGVCGRSHNFTSVTLGGQMGLSKVYKEKWVGAIEGDLNFNTNPKRSVQCVCDLESSVYDHFNLKNRGQASVVGRLGYLFNPRVVPYINAGISFANLALDYGNEAYNYFSKAQFKPGYIVGVGVDYALNQKWSLRLSYEYADYQRLRLPINTVYQIDDPTANAVFDLSTQTVKLGINYWFEA